MNKQQVFYIHGGNAFSNYKDFLNYLRTEPIRGLPWEEKTERWTNNLSTDLGENYEVFMPQMPNKMNAKYEEWKIWFERHFVYLRDGIILVGWSQGGYFFARYLTENTLPFKVKALFLLASPLLPRNNAGEDGADFNFDYDKVVELANKVDKITIFHSKDDPVVPYEDVLKYKAALPEAELVIFEDKNHFLVPELPELVDRIRVI